MDPDFLGQIEPPLWAAGRSFRLSKAERAIGLRRGVGLGRGQEDPCGLVVATIAR